MQDYKIRIEFTSPSLPGAGEGWGSVIDTDVIFDTYGLPYLPARRLKGALKNSALEIIDMLTLSGISSFEAGVVDKAFGLPGFAEGQVCFSNMYLPQYQQVSAWCRWALQEYSGVLSPDVIINTFTEIRQQTAINKDGLVANHSLRTLRVLKSGMVFEGTVSFINNNADIINLLALACANLRQIGTMRNRGFGQVECSLLENGHNVSHSVIEHLAKGVS